MIKPRHNSILNDLNKKGIVFAEKTIPSKESEIKIIYIKQITDRKALSELIVKPLIQFCSSNKTPIKAQTVIDSVIYADDCRLETDNSKIESELLNGMVIILFACDQNYIIANMKKVEHRDIPIPEITYTIRGPRDCLVENLEINLSLIRYRIKDPSLRIDTLKVGARTKTDVAVIYLQDVANDTVVNEVKKRINDISTDAIWGTGELQSFMLNNKHDLFPQMAAIERSDWVCEAIVEGKVAIIANGGQIALLAPHVFCENMMACDDRYENKYFGLFSRIIRYIALFLALCLSSLYIALVSFHTDMMPASFAILLAQMRQNVLFPSLFEVIIIELIIELLRESLMRVPSKIGTAVSIVGAIVIGQAASTAGIFSPLILIIAAMSLMASFTIPDYFAANPIRILKFLVIIMTGIFGFFGFVSVLTIIMINLVSINSFGIPYMAGFAPFNRYDFVRAFMFNRDNSPKRQLFMRTKDNTRSNMQKVVTEREKGG